MESKSSTPTKVIKTLADPVNCFVMFRLSWPFGRPSENLGATANASDSEKGRECAKVTLILRAASFRR